MKFKQYVLENVLYNDYLNSESLCNDLISYLTEMKVIKHDKLITKKSSYRYNFEVNNTEYSFVIDKIEYLPKKFIYNIHFGNNEGLSFDRLNKHNLIQVRKVFEKVITCMIYFITELNPKEFTFTGHDKKLYQTYKMIIPRIRKEKPFDNYKIQDNGRGFTFTHHGLNNEI